MLVFLHKEIFFDQIPPGSQSKIHGAKSVLNAVQSSLGNNLLDFLSLAFFLFNLLATDSGAEQCLWDVSLPQNAM